MAARNAALHQHSLRIYGLDNCDVTIKKNKKKENTKIVVELLYDKQILCSMCFNMDSVFYFNIKYEMILLWMGNGHQTE